MIIPYLSTKYSIVIVSPVLTSPTVFPADRYFCTWTKWPFWMRAQYKTFEEDKEFMNRLDNPSHNLCHDKSDFFQSSVWLIDNFAPHPSQHEGSSSGYTPKSRNRAFFNSYSLIPIPFTTGDSNLGHKPVFLPRQRRCACINRNLPMVTFSAQTALVAFWSFIFLRPYLCIWACYQYQKYICAWR